MTTTTTTNLLDRSIMAVEGGTDIAGAIVYWRLASGTNHEAVVEALAARGIDDSEAPEQPSPQAALRRVMNRVASGRDRLLYRRRGVTYVLSPEGGEDEVDVLDGQRAKNELGFRARWGVKLNALSAVEFIGAPTNDERDQVRSEYYAELWTLSTEDIGSWLLGLVHRYDALALRDSGGVYFVPRDTLDDFAARVDALHSASKCRVHLVPAVHSASAMEALLDALTSEVSSFVETVGAELSSGDLGEKAIENRRRAAGLMLSKVEHFEGLLGHKLDELRVHLTALQGAEVQAALLVQGDD